MKRFAIWVLATLALVVAILSGLFVFSPTARLVMVIVIAAIFNSGPPPIAKGVITKEDWPHFAAASKKLTEVLQSQFPVGSTEGALKAILAGQGFRPADPVPSNCVPPGQQVPIGEVYHQCLTPEQEERRKRTLVYKWGGGVCMESISVMWSSDEHGDLTHVEGGYYGACL
ncbi:hypothetical protein [Bradyrhizobium sp. CCGUVB23]|uniref:hypothetical protein n=1 Tax=Bradyrhizobium sp. CCGUVB23 TaxID=2949630 RepID=UPI0020B44DAB|nr:hypothetical protein [Bradyrhizobium sp. CCGUVB23]MCP3466928.1 hypothetical protein [Bradyrhizobium sp. CCGUVB23]